MTRFADIPLAAAVLALTGLAASAQTLRTDPGFNFSNVYNIGNVPTGSPFDITSADIPGVVISGNQVGDGSLIDQVLLTPRVCEVTRHGGIFRSPIASPGRVGPRIGNKGSKGFGHQGIENFAMGGSLF